MVSTRLTPRERQRLLKLCDELDGLPYTEKSKLLRASIAQMRAQAGVRRREVALSPAPAPPGRKRAA